MSVQVNSSAIEFSLGNNLLELLNLDFESVREVSKFLSNRGGSGRLSVSPAHHGHVGELNSSHSQLFFKVAVGGKDDILERVV